jgi:hypothetical protein
MASRAAGNARFVSGHGFSHATTTGSRLRPRRARPSFLPDTVILSAAASSRGEEATESKDPYRQRIKITQKRNSGKAPHSRASNTSPPPVIVESAEGRSEATDSQRRIPALRRLPDHVARAPSPRLGRAWLQPCRHDPHFDSGPAVARRHSHDQKERVTPIAEPAMRHPAQSSRD